MTRACVEKLLVDTVLWLPRVARNEGRSLLEFWRMFDGQPPQWMKDDDLA